MAERSLETIQKDDFAPFVGQVFKFSSDHPEWSTEFELFECEYSKKATRTRRAVREPFALLFRGLESLRLEQGNYHVENDAFGRATFFLAPVIIDEDGFFMEAVFN